MFFATLLVRAAAVTCSALTSPIVVSERSIVQGSRQFAINFGLGKQCKSKSVDDVEHHSSHQHRFDGIERIFAISDLHSDYAANLAWVKAQCLRKLSRGKSTLTPGPNDALIVAGDISHDLDVLEETLTVILSQLKCCVFFVFGNHEAWVDRKNRRETGIANSIAKIEAVEALCLRLGVHTTRCLAGANHIHPVWIVPIRSWYDGSLMLPDCDDLIEHFDTWPWTDFRLCNWTDAYPAYDSRGRGRVPKGLNEFFLGLNEKSLSCVKHAFGRSNDTNVPRPVNRTGVITFSHFLPNQRSLPDWKELNASTFRRREWLDHGAPGLSAKFAIVAGSSSVDAQIRSLLNARQRSHVHVFGHSHRPKDFEYEGIRYVHNPLGNPRERHGGMIDTKVAFKIIWDTRTLNGIIPAEQIIRYWDEKGGGKKALLRYCKGQSEAHHD